MILKKAAFAHLRGFHDDWAKNATSRVHVIQLTGTIFKLNSHVKKINVLTKNVTSRVFTCFHYIHNDIEKNAPPTGGHVLSTIWTIFELVRDINKPIVLTSHVIQLTGTIFELNSHIKETHVFTKFHENWAKNLTYRKNAPPTGGHVFSPIWTIFELVRGINQTNVLTNFHDDWAKIVTSRLFTRNPPPGSHVIHYIHNEKNAPPTGGHVFSPI
ncbi:hypothetical protein DPMN_006673 [Dreissena polymorpha]|uniref:Uncharacterized protein n=1 Tax=Dreissena polymorpha TaxID=45954 RepID=A0A9D4MVW5_DREPO|nr:hypothetical protein DPMN_006673 [Dreissena polymorpha]